MVWNKTHKMLLIITDTRELSRGEGGSIHKSISRMNCGVKIDSNYYETVPGGLGTFPFANYFFSVLLSNVLEIYGLRILTLRLRTMYCIDIYVH